MTVAAMVNRPVHHAEVVVMKGDSYRLEGGQGGDGQAEQLKCPVFNRWELFSFRPMLTGLSYDRHRTQSKPHSPALWHGNPWPGVLLGSHRRFGCFGLPEGAGLPSPFPAEATGSRRRIERERNGSRVERRLRGPCDSLRQISI